MSRKHSLVTIIRNVALLLPFVDIQRYVLGSTLYASFKVWLLVSCAYMLLVTIKAKHIKTKHIKMAIFASASYIAISIPTIINGHHESILSIARMILGIMPYTLYFAPRLERGDKKLLFSIVLVFGVASILNAISFYVFYPSMDPNRKFFYLLGVDNGSIFEASLFVIMLYYYTDKYRGGVSVLAKAISIFLLISYCYVQSGNGMVFAALLVLFAFIYKKIPAKVFSVLVFAYIVVTIVVIFNANNEILSPILTALGKSPTITGRTDIWRRSMEYIADNPLLGQGLEPYEVTYRKLLINRTHNIVLQLLYSGGLLASALFAAFYVAIYNSVTKMKGEREGRIILLMGMVLILYSCFVDFYLERFTIPLFLVTTYALANKEIIRKRDYEK